MRKISYIYQLLVGIILLLAGFYLWWRISFLRGLPYVLLFLLIYFPARRLFLNWMSKTLSVTLIILLSILIILQLVFPCRFCISKTRQKGCIQKLEILHKEKLRDWNIPYEELSLPVDGGRIRAIRCGEESADKCILLTPFHLGNWSWVYNAPELSRQYCLYAVEPIKYNDNGFAIWASYPDSSDKIEAFLEEVLTALDLESAHLIGVYDGANIACEYTIQKPEKVNSLVMISPFNGKYYNLVKPSYLKSSMFPLKGITSQVFSEIFGDRWTVVTQCREWFYNKQRCVFPGKVRLATIESVSFEELAVPYIVISGEYTTSGILMDIEEPVLNDSSYFRINGDVLINIEKSGEVNRLTGEFLSKLHKY